MKAKQLKTKALAAFVFLLYAIPLFGQQAEYGLGLGLMTYKGELAPIVNPLNIGGGISGFYKRHYNNTYSVFAKGRLGYLQASDKYSATPLSQMRESDFASFMGEVSIGFEYHFLNVRRDKKQDTLSPYFFAGLGFLVAKPSVQGGKSELVLAPTIPFGIGVKKKLNTQWDIGVELATSKTFTDKLDGFSQADAPKTQNGNPYNTDTFYVLGVTLGYRITKIQCPAHTPILDEY